MATIVEGINKLITAAGGTPTGNAGTIAEKLDQLEDVFGGGSGGGIDAYRIKVVRDEETEDVSYIADVPWVELERNPALAIVYDEDAGQEYSMFHIGNLNFQRFSVFPGSVPNFSIIMMSPDGEDETGRVFIQTEYEGTITMEE